MIDTFLAWLVIAVILVGGFCMLISLPLSSNSIAYHRIEAVNRACGGILLVYFFGKIIGVILAALLSAPVALWLLAALTAFLLSAGLLRLAIHLGVGDRLNGTAKVVAPFVLTFAATALSCTAAAVASWATMA